MVTLMEGNEFLVSSDVVDRSIFMTEPQSNTLCLVNNVAFELH